MITLPAELAAGRYLEELHEESDEPALGGPLPLALFEWERRKLKGADLASVLYAELLEHHPLAQALGDLPVSKRD